MMLKTDAGKRHMGRGEEGERGGIKEGRRSKNGNGKMRRKLEE